MENQSKNKLSVVLAVFNEAGHLQNCLSAVSDIADEIVIVDGGSSDGTLEIARKFNCKIIKTDNPPIFHINKQKALEEAKYEWILQLDADEVVTPELKAEILQVIDLQTLSNLNQPDTAKQVQNVSGYYIPRKNIMWGKWMKKGGLYPDYVIRLIKNGFAKFPCKSVHEQIVVDGKVSYLTNPLMHYAYSNESDYWRKADSYTGLTANEMKKNNLPINLFCAIKYFLIKPIITFFQIYFRHKGILDGLSGLKFAVYSGLHWVIAYKKYLLLRND